MNNITGILFKKYIINISIITVITSLIMFLINYTNPEFIHPFLPYFIIYFFSISLGFHYMLLKASEKDVKKFIPRFMGANALKLMIYLFTMLGVVLIDKATALPFLVGFFILYIIYTIFEVITFLNQSKKYN
ncbi:MAG: hypothetical protein U9R32_08090 [Bacteroidota bacterium]|nr:hypothetical protein [Bacteroidota bacterium]